MDYYRYGKSCTSNPYEWMSWSAKERTLTGVTKILVQSVGNDRVLELIDQWWIPRNHKSKYSILDLLKGARDTYRKGNEISELYPTDRIDMSLVSRYGLSSRNTWPRMVHSLETIRPVRDPLRGSIF